MPPRCLLCFLMQCRSISTGHAERPENCIKYSMFPEGAPYRCYRTSARGRERKIMILHHDKLGVHSIWECWWPRKYCLLPSLSLAEQPFSRL
ncbi:hypothetical protein IW261DRAFT_1050947 [Armillaria novae-zelandiae]|uniref:Secreted protein n=1 Tax=Armillaria novae-zelandiae TaxID=153914 RepID=A0AA39PFA4_9AGAR|nr:hypothetical protein IW261DRAFT_1050947 [Armillaria novae-zelandiae]